MTSQLQKFNKNVYQTNYFRLRILGSKKVFEKFQIGWRHILEASQFSRNKFLVIVVEIYTEADFKVCWSCPIFLEFLLPNILPRMVGALHCKYE